MKKFLWVYFLCLFSLPVQALDVYLASQYSTFPVQTNVVQGNDKGMLWVGNDQILENVDVYLFMINLETKPHAQIWSWTDKANTHGWEIGTIPLALPSNDNGLPFLPAFAHIPVAPPPYLCPSTTQCFAVFLAVPRGVSPWAREQWLNISSHPLTVESAYSRMPGQNFYLSNDGRFNVTGSVFSGGPSISNTDDIRSESSILNHEKPDVFVRNGNEIAYMNASAQRLQVIDLSDTQQPYLKHDLKLSATPKKLYLHNDAYVVQFENTLQVFHEDVDNKMVQTSQWAVSKKYGSNIIGTRRRGRFFYVLANVYPKVNLSGGRRETNTLLSALYLDENNQLKPIQQYEVKESAKYLRVFENHLAFVATNSKRGIEHIEYVHVFDLRPADTLVNINLGAEVMQHIAHIGVPGSILGESFIDIHLQQLRIAY